MKDGQAGLFTLGSSLPNRSVMDSPLRAKNRLIDVDEENLCIFSKTRTPLSSAAKVKAGALPRF